MNTHTDKKSDQLTFEILNAVMDEQAAFMAPAKYNAVDAFIDMILDSHGLVIPDKSRARLREYLYKNFWIVEDWATDFTK